MKQPAPGALPDYDRPPVTEVALGIQFAPLQLRSIDLGPLREVWRDAYPEVQEAPALAPALEVDQLRPMPIIQFGPVPMSRHLFLSPDQVRLIQVQQDRFILNWRRVQPDTEYPRYPSLRAELVDRLGQFEEFVQRALAAAIHVTQAEATYINDLTIDGPLPPSIAEAFTQWRDAPGHHLGAPAEVRFAQSFVVREEPAARMYVSLDPAAIVRPDGTTARLFTLTVRGRPSGATVQDALDFLDQARDHIVRSFTELTAEPMHLRWGLR